MKITLLLVILAIGGTMLALADDSNEIARIRGLVSIAETQACSVGARDAEGLGDVFRTIYRRTECVALQDEMVESWPFILHHLNEVAPTESEKAIIMISTGKMTVPSYLEFLANLAELIESEALDRKFFMWAQFPPEGGLCNVLIKHHAESKAKAVILRAKKIFQDVPGKIATYDAMLTGESKKKLESYEARLAPSSSEQMIRRESDGKSLASNQVTSMPMDDGRTSMASRASSGGNEPSPPPPPVRRSNCLVWPLLVVALVVLAPVAVWFLRSR